jgi:TP901 family phage tail tape measure protein
MTGGSAVSIGINMFLKDNFSAPAQRITGQTKQMQQQIRALKDETEQLQWTRNVNAGLAVVGTGALMAMGKAVKMGAEFSYMMERVKAVTGASAAEMDNLASVAKKLGRDTMYYGKDIAETMNTLALAGVSTKEIPNVAKAAVYLGGASQTKLEGEGGAADTMISIMRMFSIGEESAMRVADVLTNAANKSNITLGNLAETIKYTGTTANLLNMSLEETAAMGMVVGNAGLKGSMGGVSIENMLRYMVKGITNPTKSQRGALSSLGLQGGDLMDQNGNLKSITELMGILKNASDSKFGVGNQNSVAKSGVLQELFGVRGSRSAGLAMRLVDDYSRFLNDLNNHSAGVSERITKQMMETLKGYGDRILSNLESIAITFTTAITPTLIVAAKVIEGILGLINRILEIPFLGPFLSMVLAKFILIKTITWAWKAAMAGIELVVRSFKTTMTTTAATTVASYKAMTAAANAYKVANGRALIGNTMTAAQKAASMGGLFGAGGIGILRKGRSLVDLGSQYRNANTGRIVSKLTAARYASRFGGMGGRLGGVIGSGMMTRGGIGAILGKVALGGVSGPLGWLLTIATFLPMIISTLSGNTAAVKENNESTDSNSQSLKPLTSRLSVQDKSRGPFFSDTEAALAILNIKNGTIEDQYRYQHRNDLKDLFGKPGNKNEVHLYVDGEKKVQRIIEGNEKQIIRDSIGVSTY